MAKNRRFTRVGRLVGAFAVVGALVAGPLAGAGQAATLGSFAGQGSGFALRVVVDLSGLPDTVKSTIQGTYAQVRSALPAAQQAVLPAQFPFVIDQRFLETLSTLGANNHARALLGDGVVTDLVGSLLPDNFAGAFNKKAEATKAGQDDKVSSTPASLPGVNLPILKMGIGDLRAFISDPANTVLSNGNLASVSAGLGDLLNILPTDVVNTIKASLDNVNAVIGSATSNTGQLGSVLKTVGDTLAQTPVNSTLGGVLQTANLGTVTNGAFDPASVVNQLQSLVIPTVSDALSNVSAAINVIKNDATAQKTSSKAFSDATSSLASINVLNLLHVGVVNLASHSEAAGTPGSANNTHSCSIANLSLGTGQGVSLDGKNLIVNGVAVPVPTNLIGTVSGAVQQVLGAAGLSYTLCDAVNPQAAADGTSASQTVSALRIQFALPALAGNALGMSTGASLFKIIIDPSVETQVSASVAQQAASPALPHTGAGTVATIVTGMIVAGGALILRRRLA